MWRTGFEGDKRCPNAVDAICSARCQKFLDDAGKIVLLFERSQNVSRDDTVIIRNRCRVMPAK